MTMPWQEMITDQQLLRLREDLEYDQSTGLFLWRQSARGQTKRKGAIAGGAHSQGYVRIKTGGRTYLAHRLAWIFVHGAIEDGLQVDHINGDREDNRISNLRLATSQQNRWNSVGIPRRRRSQYKGVCRENKSSRWVARIHQSGTTHILGHFDTEAEASFAYQAAAKQMRGEYAK